MPYHTGYYTPVHPRLCLLLLSPSSLPLLMLTPLFSGIATPSLQWLAYDYRAVCPYFHEDPIFHFGWFGSFFPAPLWVLTETPPVLSMSLICWNSSSDSCSPPCTWFIVTQSTGSRLKCHRHWVLNRLNLFCPQEFLKSTMHNLFCCFVGDRETAAVADVESVTKF